MEHGAGGSVIWNLIIQSDLVTQIIMLGLLGMSIACWAIALYKFILLRMKQRQCNQVIAALKSASSMNDLIEVGQDNKKTVPGYVLIQLLAAAKQAQDHNNMEILSVQSESIIDDVMHHEQSYLSMLSVSASVATLLGLFGTVWGLIHAFVRISEKQSADIVAVAPGISEALITTIAGLFVAIPALIFFQYLTSMMRNIEYCCMHICDKVNLIARFNSNKSFSESKL